MKHKKQNPSKLEHEVMLGKLYRKAYADNKDEKEKNWLSVLKDENDVETILKVFPKLKSKNAKIYAAYLISTILDVESFKENPVKIRPIEEDEYGGFMSYCKRISSNPDIKIPLRKAKTKKAIAANIRDLFNMGYPMRDAVLMSMKAAGIPTEITSLIENKKEEVKKEEIKREEKIEEKIEEKKIEEDVKKKKKIAKTKKAKVKNNPRLSNLNRLMEEVYKNIINSYKLLILAKTPEDKERITSTVIWLQGFFFDWYDNMTLTMKIFHELFDLKNFDVNKVVSGALKFVASSEKASTDYFDKLMLASQSDKSINAVNVTAFFVDNVSNQKGKILYNEFYKKQFQKFVTNFFSVPQEKNTIDFVNFLRKYVYEFPKANHDELIKDLTKKIYNEIANQKKYSDELILINEYLRDIYKDALEVIVKSKNFLQNE